MMPTNAPPPAPLPLPGLPGGLAELERHFDKHRLSPRARQVVQEIVQGDPVRRVGGGRKNSVVRYASRKLGCVVQAESRTVEGAFVQHCEFTPHVVLYLCQPWTLTVRIVDTRGRRVPIHTVVDFLLLDSRGFRFVECKSLTELRRRSECQYPRFVNRDGRWHWPAAEEAARALGLDFELFTSEDVNPIWLRNMKFLADYMSVPAPCDAKQHEEIRSRVSRAGSTRVCELLASPEASPAAIWWLVAHNHIWCDLKRERLFEPDQAWAHCSESRMLAHRHSRPTTAPPPDPQPVAPARITPGSRVLWDEVPWTVLNLGTKNVTLQGADPDSLITVPLAQAETFLRTGQWRADRSPVADALAHDRERILRRASDQDLAEAHRRHRVVVQYLQDAVYPPQLNPRVVRRYLCWYREGDTRYGSGFLGLIRFRGRPVGISRLPDRQREVLEKVVADFAKKGKAGRVAAAHSRVAATCERLGIQPAPCEETVRRRLNQNSIPDDERERRGSRAAYQVQGPLPDNGATPRHGDRAWEVGHIDHTPLDIRLVSSKTETLLGTPWLTTYVDAYSRMPLSFRVSFDPPSRASVAAILFRCVYRHQRLSDTIVVDQGPEFNSVLLESALADKNLDKLERPPAKPRHGAVVERLFGTTNTAFIHELAGNTTPLSLGRSLSPSHHPNRSAVWTLPLLDDALERWFFEVYANRVHSELGDPPRAVFDHSAALSGIRVARFVPYDYSLRVLLAQAPRSGNTRKVHPVRGLTVRYLAYWHDDFAHRDVAGNNVRVKIDVADCSIAFAWVRRRWVTCRLSDGTADLYGRSWRQVHLALEGLAQLHRRGRAARPTNAKNIGRFLLDCDDEAVALQAERDAEADLCSRPDPPGSTPAPAPPTHAGAVPPCTRTAPLADDRNSSDGPVSSASAIEDEPDYDDLETFDAR